MAKANLVTFKADVSPYMTGDTVGLTDEELKAVDIRAKKNGIEGKAYTKLNKTVDKDEDKTKKVDENPTTPELGDAVPKDTDEGGDENGDESDKGEDTKDEDKTKEDKKKK